MRIRTIGQWSIASIVSFFVSLTAFAAGLAALFATILLIAIPWVRLPMTVTVPVSFTMDMPDQILGGRTGYGFEFRETLRPPAPRPDRINRIDGSLRIPSSSRWFIFANGVALIAIMMFFAAVLGKVREVLRTLIVDKKPFVAANATRLRWIGLAVIVGELARAGAVYAENLYARTYFPLSGVTFDVLPQPSVWTIVHGLMILVIAEVFRVGTQLDEDSSLTI